jgi:membrane protease YdiL (CAAX protease family)
MRSRGEADNGAIAYCLITFATSWTAWVLSTKVDASLLEFKAFSLSITLTRQGGLELLGNIAPGLVAILMSVRRGRLRLLLRQFEVRRSSAVLYLFAVAVPIALNLLVLVVEDGANVVLPTQIQVVTFSKTFLLNLFLAPLWEEIGWRGYLLRVMSGKNSVPGALAVVGVVWAAWHFVLYEFILRATLFSFAINFVGLLAASMILGSLYILSRHNLILPILFHVSWNTALYSVSQVEPTFHALALILQTAALWMTFGIVWYLWHEQIEKSAREHPVPSREGGD